MFKLIARWIVNALALYLVAKIYSGISVEGFGAAMVAVLVIGLVNALVKPILLLLTLPINILTLGLFTFIINALMLLLASNLTPGFSVQGLRAALVGSMLLSIFSTMLHWIVIF